MAALRSRQHPVTLFYQSSPGLTAGMVKTKGGSVSRLSILGRPKLQRLVDAGCSEAGKAVVPLGAGPTCFSLSIFRPSRAVIILQTENQTVSDFKLIPYQLTCVKLYIYSLSVLFTK